MGQMAASEEESSRNKAKITGRLRQRARFNFDDVPDVHIRIEDGKRENSGYKTENNSPKRRKGENWEREGIGMEVEMEMEKGVCKLTWSTRHRRPDLGFLGLGAGKA